MYIINYFPPGNTDGASVLSLIGMPIPNNVEKSLDIK